jgi:rhamnogalacturonyl hydrolase YesR
MKRIVFFAVLMSFTASAFSGTNHNEKVFKPKYIKSIMKKVVDWQFANPKHELYDWTNGAFFAGVYAAWETTHSKEIYNAMMDMGKKNQWNTGKRWYHSDDIAITQTYLDLYRHEKKPEMIQALKDTVEKFMKTPYPTQRPYEVIKWWWCDALFMGPPAIVKLGMVTGDERYLKFADQEFRKCYDLLYNKEENLFARDLNYVIKGDASDRHEANGKRIFWSRGNGWVMGGLVRILKELPSDYPERPFYEDVFKKMAARIASLQQSDGLWRASLLDPESYPGGEVSGSGFDCYAMAWGINNGLLDKTNYLPVVEKAWEALNKCVNKEGRVGWVQPIGGDPKKNFSESSWEVYGTGAFLLAGSEIIKLKK